MVAIALYQPDIPQNVGAMMRLAACTGVTLHIVEPCGFPWDEAKMRRAGMDYMDMAACERHASWADFIKRANRSRIVLMSTKATDSYLDFKFAPGDILLAGRESAGVPEDIHKAVAARVMIPMQAGARSLNIVNASAMVLGEALRQTHGFG